MNPILQLRLTLQETHPPIWREVQVPFGFRLDQLGTLIEMAMGWSGGQGHEFLLRGPDTRRCFVPPEVMEEEPSPGDEDERQVTIGELSPRGALKLTYLYDFGARWTVLVKVKKVLAADPQATYPICVAGKESRLPEGFGGPFTCPDPLEVLADPEDEDYADIKALVDAGYDPEHFDRDEVEEQIRNHSWE